MIDGTKILGVIPARGGSKGIPRKNLVPIDSKPLIGWTIEAAKGSTLLDRVILSSDDEEILSVASTLGSDVLRRPPELASDDTPSIAPVLHAVDKYPGYDVVVLLHPTSPLRNSDDIDRCVETLVRCDAPSSVTVCEPTQPPQWMFQIDKDNRLSSLLSKDVLGKPRQELENFVFMNGAVKAAEIEWLRKHKSFVGPETIASQMPIERSFDIDTPFDLKLVRSLVKWDKKDCSERTRLK